MFRIKNLVMYRIVLGLIALTGFAQMPVFKRYYIADIPGLGWLAQFYVTHTLHYILAGIFMGICVYAAFDFFLDKKDRNRLTVWAWIQSCLILGLVLTGLLLVVKNLPEIYFPHSAVIVLDLVHLGLCLILLGAGGFARVTGKRWIK